MLTKKLKRVMKGLIRPFQFPIVEGRDIQDDTMIANGSNGVY